jgi:serine-type D-Ala-D-Ala carboxypeptidase (penicillin-binding protein 5/6)
MRMKLLLSTLLICFLVSPSAFSATTTKKSSTAKKTAPAAPQKVKGCISKTPYVGAIIIDADSGAVLFEDNADAVCYPASTLKLMTLLVIEEKIADGSIKLTDQVKISTKACKTGGSQVYLDPRETTLTVEDLLYALMIQSANDAAVALAEHVAGTVEAFCELMNARAKQIGMNNSNFITPNGLTTSADKAHDKSTARDMAILGRQLCKYPDVFKYTSAVTRTLREGTEKPFIMTTHNPFLKDNVEGVDGFKTGFTAIAGWSIVVTCKRNNKRVIISVMGSDERLLRDAKAKELLNKVFAGVPSSGKTTSGVPVTLPKTPRGATGTTDTSTPPPPPPPSAF